MKIKIKGFDELVQNVNGIKNINNDPNFLNFIGQKSLEVLKKQTDLRLTSIQNEDDAELSVYRNNHKMDKIFNGFKLSNSTMADINNLSEETSMNYPNGFSISKAVEYGIGYVGKNSVMSGVLSGTWTHDVNNHGQKGWYYEKDGKIIWTNGYAGRGIFYFTYLEIKRLMPVWFKEYMEVSSGK